MRRRRLAVVLAVCSVLIAVSSFHGLRDFSNSAQDQEILASVSKEDRVFAIAALGQLAVKDSLSREGYGRDQFSPGWGTVAGCDMRNRILQRDLLELTVDDDGCVVESGVLESDPFTGEKISFQRGRGTSGEVHIEHLVAVSDAWRKGAQDLSEQQRWDFYNDPLNLVAVSGSANMEKGDADASAWLPQKPYRCLYVARQIAVKGKYNLWVTRSEHDAMKRVLYHCPNQLLPIEQSGL